ncbi:unnamed protein product [Phaedon cochleariae]|uniref:Double jelly roll-like domain-containing protein n=1 Tax=Phaedon cochleariae TaxID=80249 RepID=A0A9N9SD50_PHACE|nr:unnamed protein product [Phaedon cochleariae]
MENYSELEYDKDRDPYGNDDDNDVACIYCNDLYKIPSVKVVERANTALPGSPQAQSIAKITIESINLKVPHLTPNDDIKLQLLTRIKADEPLMIPFRRWELHELPALTQGSTIEIWSVKTCSALDSPRYVIVFFQTKKADSLHEDVTLFDNANIKSIRLALNSDYYPQERMLLDFSRDQYADAHFNYTEFNKSYHNCQEKRSLVNFAEFKSRPMFVIDCSRRHLEVLFENGPITGNFEGGDVRSDSEDDNVTTNFGGGDVTSSNENDNVTTDIGVVEISLSSRIRTWALNHSITHTALNDLLRILKTSIPSEANICIDARSLLSTPRTTDAMKLNLKLDDSLFVQEMYCAVKFNGKEGRSAPCSIVPLLWLNNNNKLVYWPPTVSKKKFDNMVKKQTPCDMTWKTYQVKRVLFKSNEINDESSDEEAPTITDEITADADEDLVLSESFTKSVIDAFSTTNRDPKYENMENSFARFPLSIKSEDTRYEMESRRQEFDCRALGPHQKTDTEERKIPRGYERNRTDRSYQSLYHWQVSQQPDTDRRRSTAVQPNTEDQTA